MMGNSKGRDSDERDTTGTVEGAGKADVLVVDDDSAMGRTVQRVLAGAGYEVTLVSNGPAAITAAKERAFAVIVSDIHMPGMSGVDLLRAVRGYDLDVPVILMTGELSIDTAMEVDGGRVLGRATVHPEAGGQ